MNQMQITLFGYFKILILYLLYEFAYRIILDLML